MSISSVWIGLNSLARSVFITNPLRSSLVANRFKYSFVANENTEQSLTHH
jgi:hypothetical protein